MAFSKFFDMRYKLAIHLVQVVIIIAAIGLSVPRLFMNTGPRTRANTIALGMGAKSLVFIAYQLLTENVNYFKRWASLKANLIINALEPLFWGAVAVLLIQANITRCVKVSCILSWIVVGLSIVLNILATYMVTLSYLEYRDSKQESNLRQSSSRETQMQNVYETKYEQRCVELERQSV